MGHDFFRSESRTLLFIVCLLLAGCFEGPTIVAPDRQDDVGKPDFAAEDRDECVECAAGDTRCAEGNVEECVVTDDCGGWAIIESCTEAQTCTEGQCVCDAACDLEAPFLCAGAAPAVCVLEDGCPVRSEDACLGDDCNGGCANGRECINVCESEGVDCYRCV